MYKLLLLLLLLLLFFILFYFIFFLGGGGGGGGGDVNSKYNTKRRTNRKDLLRYDRDPKYVTMTFLSWQN